MHTTRKMRKGPQQPQQPQQPALDAAFAATAAGASVPSRQGSGHIGRSRLVVSTFLALLAVAGCWFALDPGSFGTTDIGVSFPEFVLALSASAVIGAVYFALSAQVKRATAETRQATEAVEQRTGEAIEELRDEVATLQGAVAQRSEQRIAETGAAAQTVTSTPTVEALDRLLRSAAERGLMHGPIQTVLQDDLVLTFQRLTMEGQQGPSRGGVHVEVVELGPEAAPSRKGPSRRPVERLGPPTHTTIASVLLEEGESATDGFADLNDGMLRKQRAWKSFAADAEQALERLSSAVQDLSQAIEEAEEPLAIGSIKTVLDDEDRHVLMRHPAGGKALITVGDPTRVIRLTTEIAEQAGETPEGVLGHPAVVRQLRRLRAAAKATFTGSADQGPRGSFPTSPTDRS